MICPKCGFQNANDKTHCAMCGLSLMMIPHSPAAPKKEMGVGVTVAISVAIVVVIGLIIIFFKGKNEPENKLSLLYGEWVHRDSGGSYVFKKDGNYEFYVYADHSDNYCNGKMDLSYGVLLNNGEHKYTDDDGNLYYNLITYPETCILDGETRTYTEKEGALQFILTVYAEDNTKMNLLNMENRNSFELNKK